MEKKFINFDTNYINKILDNELEANKILKELKQEYNFSINIATFVEIVQQKINNKLGNREAPVKSKIPLKKSIIEVSKNGNILSNFTKLIKAIGPIIKTKIEQGTHISLTLPIIFNSLKEP